MNMYGEGLDPIPFISASYGVTLLLLLGAAVWLIFQHKRLSTLKAVVAKEVNQK